jgi:hypothetical protein
MKARHLAALSTFLVVILSLAILVVISLLKTDPKPKEIGEFEFEGARTKVYRAGDCQVFATKWKSNENPNFFFSCGDRK